LKNAYCNVDELPLSMTVDDVGSVMGLSRNKAYELCHTKGFPCVAVGKRMIIPKLAFIKWMESPTLG
jgi:excisionase family DNA binding protein